MTADELDARLALARRILLPMYLALARADAKAWVQNNLRPSAKQCPLSSSGLKAQWAQTTDRYLNQSQFLAVLAECGMVPGCMTADDEWNVRAEFIG